MQVLFVKESAMYKVVIPGDFLSEDANSAGEGTYVEGNRVYSMKYGIVDEKEEIKVVALSGKYVPKKGESVIGIIKELSFPYWIVDINSPYKAGLHILEFNDETGKKVEFGNMDEYLNIGDAIVAKVINVDVLMRVELVLRTDLKLPQGGRMVEILPSKVPRIIGREGSMIKMLKEKSNCFIFIGKNGRIWINGRDEDVDMVFRTILKIANEAHTSGLTDRITHFMDSFKRKK